MAVLTLHLQHIQWTYYVSKRANKDAALIVIGTAAAEATTVRCVLNLTNHCTIVHQLVVLISQKNDRDIFLVTGRQQVH